MMFEGYCNTEVVQTWMKEMLLDKQSFGIMPVFTNRPSLKN
jgi:hypothetical protein